MIEEFIQSLQQAEVEADGVIKAAREKVQTIGRDSESAVAMVRGSVELSLQLRLVPIDQEAEQQMRLADDQFRVDLEQRLESLERQAQDHRRVVLDLLLSKLIAR